MEVIAMRQMGWTGVALGVLVLAELAAPPRASAQYYRQYYEPSWTYNEINSYYYKRYYYYPAPAVQTYSYHYTVYYPTYPSYVYYYNPVRQVYWGRYEFDENGKGKGYSLLEEKDRKKSIKDIPESAFPKPAEMPVIPDAEDKEKMLPPPADRPKELPKDKDK